MKINESAYIASRRGAMDKLSAALDAVFPYSSVLLQDSVSRTFVINATGAAIKDNEPHNMRGGVIRVHDGRGIGEYSFTSLSEENIPEMVAQVKAMTPLSGGDPVPAETQNMEKTWFTSCETDPQSVDSGEILKRLTEIRTDTLNADSRILDSSVRFGYEVIHKRFVSGGRRLEQNIIWSEGVINVMAQKGDEIKEFYKGFSLMGGAELMNEMSSGIAETVSGVIDLLDSEPIEPGEYDCVCAPDVTGTIAHEAFGHGVEMDMFVKKRALAEQFVGQYVASPLVTMHDSASAVNQTATFFFDDEGTLSQDTVIIEDGVLKKGICDILSAQRLDTQPTGNGRRESFERKAYTRMTNTYFEGGSDSVEDMIASIKYGFLLENMFSGMEDPKNWGIQLMVNMAREIKDGKLTGKVFSPIVMTGYVPDLLKSISMISPNVVLEGGGHCGKGYKEWVKVSDGGPYIKARIRLG